MKNKGLSNDFYYGIIYRVYKSIYYWKNINHMYKIGTYTYYIRFISILLIYNLFFSIYAHPSQFNLRVPLDKDITAVRLQSVLSRQDINVKFQLAKEYSVTKQNNDFMYAEAAKELFDILCSKYDAMFPERFMKEINSVRETEDLVDDPQQARINIETALESFYPQFLFKTDEHAGYLFDLLRRQEALRIVTKKRFDKQGFVETIIVPDGEGDYFVGTAGIEGEWDIELNTQYYRSIEDGAILRFLDNLSSIMDRVKRGKIKLGSNIPVQPTDDIRFEKIYVISEFFELYNYAENDPDLYWSDPLGLGMQFIPQEDPEHKDKKIYHVRMFIVDRVEGWNNFLNKSRIEQKRQLRQFFTHPPRKIIDTLAFSHQEKPSYLSDSSGRVSYKTVASGKSVLLVNSGPYRQFGNEVLKRALEKRGIPVSTTDFLASDSFFGAISSPRLATNKVYDKDPNIIGIAIGDDNDIAQISEAINVMHIEAPQAFIIVGGPSTKTPKSLLATLPGIDILIRGEAEEILPKVVEIIGDADKVTGLTEEQINKFKKLPGIFIRIGRRIIFSHLEHTNSVSDFEVPVVRNPGCSFYNYNISRGCPYDCAFCRINMGRSHRITPLENIEKGIFEALATQVPLDDIDILRDLLDILRVPNVAVLAESKELQYVPQGTYTLSNRQVVAVLDVLDKKLGSCDDNVKREIGKILGIAIPVKSWSELEVLLPAAIPSFKVRSVILCMRRAWVQNLVAEGRDLLKYGLDKIDWDSGNIFFIASNIRFPEDVMQGLAEILGVSEKDEGYDSFVESIELYLRSHELSGNDFIRILELLHSRLFFISGDTLKKIVYQINAIQPECIQGSKENIIDFDSLKSHLRKDLKICGTLLWNVIVTIKADWVDSWYRNREHTNYANYEFSKLHIVPNEDNTFVDKEYIMSLCNWIIFSGLNRYFSFSGGQNSILTFMSNGRPDEEFMALLSKAGFRYMALGTDGLTPQILRQNKKGYGFSAVMEVNEALKRHNIFVENNPIHSTPESTLLDTAESFFMAGLFPFNLRKEDFSLAYGLYIVATGGSNFTNEDIALYPHRYDWKNRRSKFTVLTNAFYSTDNTGMYSNVVPLAFPEYPILAVSDERLHLRHHDTARFLSEYLEFRKKQGFQKREFEFLEERYPELAQAIVQRWQSEEEKDPEIRALGEIFKLYQGQNPQMTIFDVGRAIRNDMTKRKICTFRRYLKRYEKESGISRQEHHEAEPSELGSLVSCFVPLSSI